MKTTLEIADDVWSAALVVAKRENKSVGEVISELARAALTARHSFRPFASRGQIFANEMINKLRDGDVY